MPTLCQDDKISQIPTRQLCSYLTRLVQQDSMHGGHRTNVQICSASCEYCCRVVEGDGTQFPIQTPSWSFHHGQLRQANFIFSLSHTCITCYSKRWSETDCLSDWTEQADLSLTVLEDFMAVLSIITYKHNFLALTRISIPRNLSAIRYKPFRSSTWEWLCHFKMISQFQINIARGISN